MTLEEHNFTICSTRGIAGAEFFRGRRLHAVAGIGNPARFFRYLQGLGLDFIAHLSPIITRTAHPILRSDATQS